jgi:hypothetical protein
VDRLHRFRKKDGHAGRLLMLLDDLRYRLLPRSEPFNDMLRLGLRALVEEKLRLLVKPLAGSAERGKRTRVPRQLGERLADREGDVDLGRVTGPGVIDLLFDVPNEPVRMEQLLVKEVSAEPHVTRLQELLERDC